MIKPGDRVTLFSDMRKKATVLSLNREKATVWYVGGTSDLKTEAHIRFDNGEEVTLPVNLLMPLHE
jgi:vacuolar-type H+-ATPase subunit B/Vma2